MSIRQQLNFESVYFDAREIELENAVTELNTVNDELLLDNDILRGDWGNAWKLDPDPYQLHGIDYETRLTEMGLLPVELI